MARVRVHPSDEQVSSGDKPSDQLIKSALKEEVVTDSTGRKLTMRKPHVLAQFKLIEALGALADNRTYMQMATPLLYLGAIDGDPVAMPRGRGEIDALITRLDDHGLAEVMTWYMVNVLGPTNDMIESAEKAQADKAVLKN